MDIQTIGGNDFVTWRNGDGRQRIQYRLRHGPGGMPQLRAKVGLPGLRAIEARVPFRRDLTFRPSVRAEARRALLCFIRENVPANQQFRAPNGIIFEIPWD